MTLTRAKEYCDKKRDLGLKWRLPSEADFNSAFNPKNISDVLETKGRILWTSSLLDNHHVQYFDGNEGKVHHFEEHYSYYEYSVRCVAREKQD
jgi:hypothetical protein